ncbi:ATP-binding protein [Streptomyces sp. NPDC005281]|uniref:ATP-binding protein n=1 Tax=Streptomyces sp. NPDC005281 TaxID=3155712 RepID=UPI0033A0E6B6
MTIIKQRLSELRRQAFAGRTGEIELFRSMLGAGGVLYLHGPGGIGKSALLDVLADVAVTAGADPTTIDGRDVPPVPGSLEAHSISGRAVLLLDTYELLAPIDDWVREEFLPGLPADAVVVIAARRPPSSRWLADPAWRELVRVVALRNLAPRDGRAYLAGQNVPAEFHERLLDISHGHPLTLSMLVDAVRRGGGVLPRTLGDLPDVVRSLLTRTLDDVPSPRHRLALEVCAHANVITENVLRSVVGDNAGELFTWLRTLSFVGEGPYGLFLHDTVRDVLDADLRWRDPQRYAEVHHQVRADLVARIRSAPDPREQQRLLADAIVVTCPRTRLAAYVAAARPVDHHIDALRPQDTAAIVEMTTRAQGAEQAELVACWIRRQPGAFRVFRGPAGEPRGFGACLDLRAEDLGVDPGVDSMWQYTQQHGAARPGEHVRAWRFFLDRDRGQASSPSLTLFAVCQILDILTRDHSAWTLVGAYADAGLWEPTLGYLDFWPAAEATYTIGETTYPVFVHDWRRTGLTEWLELTAAREVGAPARPAQQQSAELVLSQPEFAESVRAALRDLHAPQALRRNPLMRSRVVRSSGSGLDELLAMAAEPLRADRRGLFEVVDRTFLHPAGPQERVAQSLHLSFSTYRRHRDLAVAHITDWMWEREVYGHKVDTA